MEPIYANVILWAVLLFLSCIGYAEAIARLLNRERHSMISGVQPKRWHGTR
jgi:hypothetical protein